MPVHFHVRLFALHLLHELVSLKVRHLLLRTVGFKEVSKSLPTKEEEEEEGKSRTGQRYCSAVRSFEDLGEPCRSDECCSFVPSAQASWAGAVIIGSIVVL